MVRRLVRGGHQCIVFDVLPAAVDEPVRKRIHGTVLEEKLYRERADHDG
jgi:6-phosphogluconate dehydrogenase (decarboxylating)